MVRTRPESSPGMGSREGEPFPVSDAVYATRGLVRIDRKCTVSIVYQQPVADYAKGPGPRRTPARLVQRSGRDGGGEESRPDHVY
jgi:hypothetical protein